MRIKTKNKFLRCATRLACIALAFGLSFSCSMQINKVTASLTTKTIAECIPSPQSVEVDGEASQTTYFAGGTEIPEDYRNQPSLLIMGFAEMLNDYYELEDYGNNKELVLINGRSWSKWETRPGDTLNKLWVRSAGTNACYLGFDFNGTSKLKLPSQSGGGELLQTIVIKRGFQFVNTTSSQWGVDGVIYKDSPVVTKVVGELRDNIILKVKATGGFEVIVGGLESVEQQGESQYGVVTGDSVSLRSGPSKAYDVCAQVARDTKLIYLGEVSNGWYKVDYEGNTGWISALYFTIVGYETVIVQKPISLDGYKLEVKQEVLATDTGYIAKNPTQVNDAEIETWGITEAGATYKYLGETSNVWYKVDYAGNVGWVSSLYSTLLDAQVEITPLNADWQEDDFPSEDSSVAEDSEAEESSEDSSLEENSSDEYNSIEESEESSLKESSSEGNSFEESIASSEEESTTEESSYSSYPSEESSSSTEEEFSSEESFSYNESVENSKQESSVETEAKGCSSSFAVQTSFVCIAGLALTKFFRRNKKDESFLG